MICGYMGYLIWNEDMAAYRYYTCPVCHAERKHLDIKREFFNG
jgi:hypothetical protein